MVGSNIKVCRGERAIFWNRRALLLFLQIQMNRRDLLLQLNAHKSMGPDGMHPRVLKELPNVVAGPLFLIFQRFWESGEVPVDWALANVVPIFRKGKMEDLGN